MIQRINRQQVVPAPIEEVWDYFATPENLNEMTPPNMNFEIVHGVEDKMRLGQLIEYGVRFMPVFKSRWLTEIAHVEEGAYFVDEQRIGPYNFWYHEHSFEATENGTRITDQVTYQLPLGPLGDLVHAFWVGPRLKGIFNYRQEKIAQLFGIVN